MNKKSKGIHVCDQFCLVWDPAKNEEVLIFGIALHMEFLIACGSYPDCSVVQSVSRSQKQEQDQESFSPDEEDHLVI